ncbi:MAG: hypothetical protein LBI03_08075, partial [Clostridiales bacterium]|nr:hypothetical protein [Clostridiales bacterium]
MNYDNLKKSSVQSLINGFESQGNDYVCLWCDKKFGDSAGAKSHVEKTHPLEERFKILLGGDNLLRFSPIDKALLTMMFKSVDQKTIAEGLNINYGTVRAKRKLFYEEFVSSKLKAVLFNMVFENQPQRQYNKKKVV